MATPMRARRVVLWRMHKKCILKKLQVIKLTCSLHDQHSADTSSKLKKSLDRLWRTLERNSYSPRSRFERGAPYLEHGLLSAPLPGNVLHQTDGDLIESQPILAKDYSAVPQILKLKMETECPCPQGSHRGFEGYWYCHDCRPPRF